MSALTDFIGAKQWVAWRIESRGDDVTKVPYISTTRRAESDNPSAWLTRDEAALVRDKILNGTGSGGIGIMLGALGDTWIAGVDLDRCRGLATGKIEPWAEEVIDRLATYREVSPSGTGVKTFFLIDPVDIPELRQIMGTEHGRQFKRDANGVKHPPAIELYTSNRYFAVTGDALDDTNQLRMAPLDDLRWLIKQAGPSFTGKPSGASRDGSRSATAFRIGAQLRRQGMSFEEMCDALRTEPETAEWCREKGDANGGRELRRIWEKAEPASDTGDDELDAAIIRLVTMPAARYERMRKTEAERLGIRASALDRLVAQARGAAKDDDQQGQPLSLPSPKPWPDAVDGAELLTNLAAFFKRHAFVAPSVPEALALWAVHTFTFDLFTHTPRLHVRSITKNSGKTTVLDLLELVVCRPLPAAHATSSVLFRVIEIAKPALLIDEADTFIRDADDVRGILNAGHKRGGQVLRTVGDDFEPRAFSVFAPVAIAGIGDLPGTIADRSITIPMKRALKSELPSSITRETRTEAIRFARSAARWTLDYESQLAAADPDMGDMFNRRADNWRALFAIADTAGAPWPTLARDAARVLSVADDETETLGVKLLADIYRVFNEAEFTRDVVVGDKESWITSADLVAALVKIDGRPWAELGRAAKPLTQNRLARLLKPFAIVPRDVGPEDARKKGYALARFLDAFARHLST